MSGRTPAGAQAPVATDILQVRNLRVAYGKVEALHGASLRVGAGQIATVIGPNGAGKTTMLSAIMGLLPCTGEIEFMGRRQKDVQVERQVAMGMTLVPEKRELFGEMSVEDNLLLGAFQRYRAGDRDQVSAMAEVFRIFPRLRERRRQLAGTLSGGERQMLAVGRALMARPRLLMLDEPSLGLAPLIVGLAPLIVREIFHVIADLKETGELVMEGPAAELADHPRVVESYLGLGVKE